MSKLPDVDVAEYVIVVGDRRYPLKHVLVIGRGALADIVVDDGTVSRAHTRITPGYRLPFLEDLGSTNGTSVNGIIVSGEHELHHGDVVRVGETELTLLRASMAPESGRAKSKSGQHNRARSSSLDTHPAEVFEILAEAAFEALALGDARRADAIVGRRLIRLLGDARQREIIESQFELAVKLSLALARQSGDPKWVDALVEFHDNTGRRMASYLIDALYELANTVVGINPRVLERYCDRLEHLDAQGDRSSQLDTKRVCALLPLIRF